MDDQEVRRRGRELNPDRGDLQLPAAFVHGPEDAERDADGNVNCEVVGFVLSGEGLPTVYISGDNASIRAVVEIARRAPAVDAAVVHVGRASVEGKFRGRPLSLDGVRAAAVAAVLGAPLVLPAHYDGWLHFSEGRDAVERAFDEAGLSARLGSPTMGAGSPCADGASQRRPRRFHRQTPRCHSAQRLSSRN